MFLINYIQYTLKKLSVIIKKKKKKCMLVKLKKAVIIYNYWVLKSLFYFKIQYLNRQKNNFQLKKKKKKWSYYEVHLKAFIQKFDFVVKKNIFQSFVIAITVTVILTFL